MNAPPSRSAHLGLWLLALLAPLPPAARAADLAWVPTPPMNAGRYLHTATLLENGQVLVTGGGDLSTGSLTGLSGAEIYDPATDSWSAASPMSAGRYSHTATLLANGTVLVAGGGCGSDCYLSSAEVFDPATRTWSPVGGLKLPRDRHQTARLPDGRVLVAGGRVTGFGSTSSAEVYDPATRSFTGAAAMATPRQLHTATAGPGGRIVVAGGAPLTDSAEAYDPAAGAWAPIGPMGSRRQDHAACLLADGRVLVSGGRFTFDPFLFPVSSTAEVWGGTSWSATASEMTNPRMQHTATRMPDGLVLVAGGYPFNAFATELFDPASGAWAPGPAMNRPRTNHTATLLPDGRVLVAGAFGGGLVGGDATAEVLTPTEPVGIDVKPGDPTNPVSWQTPSRVPVAVLSSPGFDAPAAVVVSTIRFGRTGTEAPAIHCSADDVNGDRLPDLVCTFSARQAFFVLGDTVGVLRALTTGRVPVVGRDAVRLVP